MAEELWSMRVPVSGVVAVSTSETPGT